MDVSLVYDGKCPICRRIAAGARVYQRRSHLELVDARSKDVGDVQGRDLRGLDFDEGFAVVVDGGVYHQGEAARVLAVLTKDRGLGYRLFRWLMRDESRNAYWFPILSSMRRRLMSLMRVPPIRRPTELGASRVAPSESN